MPTALVTGASAGLGNAYARELARRGYDLVLVARDTARLEAYAKTLHESYGIVADPLTADLSTDAGIDATARAVTEHEVDLLVNNAGASIGKFYGETDIADETRQLDLLVRAPLVLTDAALRVMRARGSGRILNVGSVAAFTPRGTYSAHKAWIVNLSQWLNIQYAREGVVTTAVCPGYTHTEFHQRMNVDKTKIPRPLWLDADRVVTESLRDLDRGKALSIPSKRYKVLAALARYTPPTLVARFAKMGRNG